MEVVNITPTGPLGKPIKNKNFSNFLLKNILQIWNAQKCSDSQFPGPQPVSIEKKDFEKLKKYTYHVSIKTNGIRFILYFIKDRNGTNQCILINRALQFFIIDVECEESVFNGTIFDGELYNNDGKWEFIVHDSVIICGTKINRGKFSERLGEIQCCINACIPTSDKSTVRVTTKNFYLFSDFDNFIVEEYNKTTLSHDGIIFMPESLPVISGTQYSMFKWKPKELHTFDFLIKNNDKDIDVFVFNMGKIIQFAKVMGDTDRGKKFIEVAKNLPEYKNDCIVECSFVDNNFTPVMIRTDKTHSNSLRTVERTLFNINEGITIDDFSAI
jgi:hypothetical protein